MSRRRKDPLRTLSADERGELARLSRSRHAPAAQVARATALLAVADGGRYLTARRRPGPRAGGCPGPRRRGAERPGGNPRPPRSPPLTRGGLAGVAPPHGGGPPIRY